MSRTIRKNLIFKARSALNLIDSLDEYIVEMHEMHQDRQPAIEKLGPIIVRGQEQLRVLWKALLQAL